MSEQEQGLKERTIKSVGIVYVMVALTKILNLVALVVLARILIPRDFGLVGLSAVIIGIVALFKDFGLSAAYVHRSKNLDDAANVVFWSNIGIRLFLYVIVFLLAPLVADFFAEPLVDPILKIASISFVIESLGSAHSAILTKNLRFGRIAIISIVTAVVMTVTSITLALLGFSFWSLVYASLIGEPIGVLLYWKLSKWRPRFSFRKEVAKQMFVYGRDIVGINSLGFGVKNLDNFAVGKVIGAEALGAYTLSYRFGLFSSTNIVALLARVLFPAYSKIKDDLKRIRRAYLRSFYPISMLSFPVALGLIVLAEEFVYFVLGPNWSAVILPLQVLSIYGLMYSLAGAGSNVFLAMGKTHIPLRITALEVLIMLAALYPATYYGLVGVAVTVTVAIAIGSVISIILVLRLLEVRRSDVYPMVQNPLVSSMIMLLALLIIRTVAPFSPLVFVMEVVVGTLVYAAVLQLTSKGELRRQVAEIVSALRSKGKTEDAP
jgi:PST family polysaccharide transporter